ncbi:MAG: carbamoyltransferase HypF, partial [Campylobacterota bacterium]|nr:carbamoyltransferase HypF [Campylobacterota bacterium]
TVAIVVDDKVILSPYIGDLDSLSSLKHYHLHVEMLKRVYQFEPDIVVCDKHPNYESTKYAKELVYPRAPSLATQFTLSKNPNLKLIQVQHHYAHILATMGVNNISTKVLGVAFDGTGYGLGGNLWGGEFFVCDLNSYERVGHFKEFRLLGGEKAIKEPRRVALSFLFELYGDEVLEMKNSVISSFTCRELQTLHVAWKKELNSPLSSSCGRLFDAVVSLLDIRQVCSYEGESGLMLEGFYDEEITTNYEFSIDDGVIDFSLIVKQILKEDDKKIAVSKFFNTLVEIIYKMSKLYNLPVVLGGGVFQNRVLLRLIMKKIPDVVLPKDFVSNDSAIAYGQALAVLNN